MYAIILFLDNIRNSDSHLIIKFELIITIIKRVDHFIFNYIMRYLSTFQNYHFCNRIYCLCEINIYENMISIECMTIKIIRKKILNPQKKTP